MKSCQKQINIILFAILSVSLVLSLMHSLNELVDDFAYSNVVLVEIYKALGHVVVKPFSNAHGFFVHHVNDLSYRPLSSLLFLILEYFSGLSARHWIAVPFVGFYGFLVIYLIARADLRIPVLYAALTAMLGININANVVLGTTFYYVSIGYSLAFLTIKILNRYIIWGDEKAVKIVLLYCILAPYFYYTMSYIINIVIFSLVTYYVLFKIKIKRSNIKLSRKNKITFLLLVIGLMTFLNERTPYTVLKEYNGSSYLLESIKTIINILNISLKKSGYVVYKPVFLHYGHIADILQKVFFISYFSLFIISFLYIINISRKGLIIYIYKNIALFVVFVATVAHMLVYLSIGEVNLLMFLIFVAMVGSTAIRELIIHTKNYKEGLPVKRVLFIILVILLVLSATTGYTKQIIFATDNIYGDFFTKSANVVNFIHIYTNNSCINVPSKVFMYHHTLAYTTFVRVENSISDCVYPEYILLDKYTIKTIINYIYLKTINIFYVNHIFAPFVRIGVKGVYKNMLPELVENINISNITDYIYSDRLNIIQAVLAENIL